ncbi:MAG: hypothetical protein VKK42_02800, partial [Lyngbya sp.]|nr:hypothetical protein [Lyngbya sp.]
MSRRGRSRPASSNDEKSERTDEESPSSSIPLVFEYESEDGARISIDPGGIELSREYEVSEDLNVEISYEVDWGIGDVDVKRKGLDLDDLEISGEIGLPGDLLGFGGGVTLDLSTGEISGGEVSVEAGGVEIELSVTENGCKVGLSVSILGIGVGVTKDICEDEEEEEEEEDNKKPSSNDRLTQESVEDIMKRWREKGDENICGDIPLHLHT